jgi:hypothetical protein
MFSEGLFIDEISLKKIIPNLVALLNGSYDILYKEDDES